MIARALFDNLQVPSISFASSHLLSLVAVGRITGLVLDCGNLESVALPVSTKFQLSGLLTKTVISRYLLPGLYSPTFERLLLQEAD